MTGHTDARGEAPTKSFRFSFMVDHLSCIIANGFSRPSCPRRDHQIKIPGSGQKKMHFKRSLQCGEFLNIDRHASPRSGRSTSCFIGRHEEGFKEWGVGE